MFKHLRTGIAILCMQALPDASGHPMMQESRKNVLKDFVQVAGPLGVTHFLMLSATQRAGYLRVAKTPRGPTLTLRVLEYSLMRDVQSAQQRPRCPQVSLVRRVVFCGGGGGREVEG